VVRILAIGTEAPARAPGRPPSAERGAGFTLIEVLVVVAIVGVVVAVAAVNLIPSDMQVARREISHVALLMEHARDAAWFGGRPMAVTLGEGRLREWKLAGRSWSPSTDEPLAPDVRLDTLYVDGQMMDPRERLLFLPDGLGVPFRVALQVRGQHWAIEGDAAGAVSVVAP
jgi:general secretion pathway protein H